MATENIPQIDKMIKDLGTKISKITGEKQKDIEEEILRLRKLFESEEKPMLHNVTIKHEENKVLEWVWVMIAMRNSKIAEYDQKTRTTKDLREQSRIVDKKELDHAPILDKIAQFLSDNKADFVSVVQNYRFEN